MIYLVLSIAAAAAVVFELWAIQRGKISADDYEMASRRRITRELADIEQHRPDHLIDNERTDR